MTHANTTPLLENQIYLVLQYTLNELIAFFNKRLKHSKLNHLITSYFISFEMKRSILNQA